MKKLSTALIALFMVMVMCFSSFAATLGSITVTGVKEGKSYDIYRIFDLTGSDTNDPADGVFDLYSYTINSDWVDFFIGDDAPGKGFLVKKTDPKVVPPEYKGCNELTYEDPATKIRYTYFMNITDANVAELSQLALTYSVKAKLTPVGSWTADEDGDHKFNDIPLGYYLVYPRGAADIIKNENNWASICSLESTTPNGTIAVKATYPVIEKEVDDPSVEVGQTVTFTVKGQVPDTTGYDAYKYIVTDTMTDGLKFDGIDMVKVTFGGVDVTSEKKSLTESSNGFRLEYDMAEFQDYAGEEIVITYTATVTDDAVCQLTENSAVLEYSNDPKATESTYPNPPEEVEVYSSQIKVIKTDNEATPSTKNLKDAEFYLWKASPSEYYGKYYKCSTGDSSNPGEVTWVDTKEDATKVVTDENGEAVFAGLEDGIYWLHEEKAPAGYSVLDHDEKIEVAGAAGDDGKMVGVTVEEQIVNVPGKRLPATGGTGTTILYIIGGILVVGAGILLITKKRIESEE